MNTSIKGLPLVLGDLDSILVVSHREQGLLATHRVDTLDCLRDDAEMSRVPMRLLPRNTQLLDYHPHESSVAQQVERQHLVLHPQDSEHVVQYDAMHHAVPRMHCQESLRDISSRRLPRSSHSPDTPRTHASRAARSSPSASSTASPAPPSPPPRVRRRPLWCSAWRPTPPRSPPPASPRWPAGKGSLPSRRRAARGCPRAAAGSPRRPRLPAPSRRC